MTVHDRVQILYLLGMILAIGMLILLVVATGR